MKGIIIDIETLSNTSNAAILEIGAIYFEGFEVKDIFYYLYTRLTAEI